MPEPGTLRTAVQFIPFLYLGCDKSNPSLIVVPASEGDSHLVQPQITSIPTEDVSEAVMLLF